MALLFRIAVPVFVFAALAAGQDPDSALLVKQAVANEVQATEHPPAFMMYRLTKETRSGTQVRDMVETKDGIVARVISVNGRPLTATERNADDQRLENLSRDPSEQLRKRTEQQREMSRFLSVIKALPDALIYTYDGAEQLDGRQTVRFRFHTNPAYHSVSIETAIFRAADGFIWIDPLEKRIVKFDGLQTSQINIGWGLLGHIDKGSKIRLAQQRLDDGQWRLHDLTLQGSGQIFLFKSVTMNQKESATGYRAVPHDLNVPQAVALLRKQEEKMASSRPD